MDDIINYVTNTPANSNPNVLRDMLKLNNNTSDIFRTVRKKITIPEFNAAGTLDTSDSFSTIKTADNITITINGDTLNFDHFEESEDDDDRIFVDISDLNPSFNGYAALQKTNNNIEYEVYFYPKNPEGEILITEGLVEIEYNSIELDPGLEAKIQGIVEQTTRDEAKFIPIYFTTSNSSWIDLTEDQVQEIYDVMNSRGDGNIPYLDVTFTGGMVPSHSLFFYGHKEENTSNYTFIGGTRIAIFTGRKIIFAPIEQPKLTYTTQYNNINWKRNGADVLVKCGVERSNFTNNYVNIPGYVKPDSFTLGTYAPIFNLTQNKMAGYVKVNSTSLEFFWFDDGAINTDRIAFSINYKTDDSYIYPDNESSGS